MHVEGPDGKAVVGRDEDNDRNLRPFELLQDRETIQVRHLHIQENELGRGLPDGIQRFQTGRAFGHDLRLRLLLQKMTKPLPAQGFVVGNQNAQFH